MDQNAMMQMFQQMMMNNNNMNMGNMGGNMGNMGGNMDQNMMMNMMQMMMQNNMNNMQMNNMPMSNMSTGNMSASSSVGGWNLFFSKKSGGQKITIQISPNELVSEAISKYKTKSLDNNANKYIYNGKEICQSLKISASGLQNGSEILVLSVTDVEGA